MSDGFFNFKVKEIAFFGTLAQSKDILDFVDLVLEPDELSHDPAEGEKPLEVLSYRVRLHSGDDDNPGNVSYYAGSKTMQFVAKTSSVALDYLRANGVSPRCEIGISTGGALPRSEMGYNIVDVEFTY